MSDLLADYRLLGEQAAAMGVEHTRIGTHDLLDLLARVEEDKASVVELLSMASDDRARIEAAEADADRLAAALRPSVFDLARDALAAVDALAAHDERRAK